MSELKAAPLPEQSGSMIGFFLSSRDALALRPTDEELPEGAVREEMLHLTLCFLGAAEDVIAQRYTLGEIMRKFSAQTAPITATITGLGVFNQPDQDVLYASVASAGLNTLRGWLLDFLGNEGIVPASDYEFTPHITLAYVPKDSEVRTMMVPSETIEFAAITLTFGNEHHTYPLSGEAVHEAITDLAQAMQANAQPAVAEAYDELKTHNPVTRNTLRDSRLGDDWTLEGAMETAVRVVMQMITKSTPHLLWVGVSMNSFIDRNGIPTITPRKAIALDILSQHHAIKTHAPRARWQHSLNGTHYEDYGALLLDHDWKKPFGRTSIRLMLKDGKSCFEIGWCLDGFSGERSKMSIGFIPHYGSDGNVDLIHKYESSALIKGREASSHTFFKTSRPALFKDRNMQVVLDQLGRSLPPVGQIA